MPSVFLSHSSQDKPFVRELADFLQKDPADQITVWLDEREIAPGQNIVTKIQQDLDSDFIILILSPDSVNSPWVKEEWTDAFWDQTNNQQTKLLGVLYRDCVMPRLLRNKKYFDLRNNQLDGFRAIKTFLLTQQPVSPAHINQLPTRPPLFIGRERELAELRRRLSEKGALVYIAEMAGQGKTTLALEFAHRYQSDFESVYWLPCQSGSLTAIASDLERQLGLKLQKDLADMLSDLKDICAKKRCLLIFDNVDNEEPAKLMPGGIASVLVTTRHHNLRFLRGHHPLDVPLFTQDECFAVFHRELGTDAVKGNEAQCETLFKRLGYLPFAVAVAASLIREDVRYTIASLAADLPADVKELLHQAIQALEAPPRQLLNAMAACAPEGFALSLAAEIAGFDEKLSRSTRRYRLHALVRETADGKPLALAHAEAIHKRFENWERDWKQCEQDLSDFQLAFNWALSNRGGASRDFPLAWLAYYGYMLTSRIGRPAEALEICERMAAFYQEGNDNANRQTWLGNQAVILKDWGRLDEALVLLKKQEEICLALGNQDGLQRSYGNQALILQDRGRLDEALALLRKQEEICLDLGNQDSLQRSYGNQAIILKDQGKLDEALALYKKKEEICLTLGNRSSLGNCYWNWGLLERAFGHPEAEKEKLSAALAIFEALKMPRERDAVKSVLAETRATGAP